METYGHVFAGLYNKKWSNFALQAAPRIWKYYVEQAIHLNNNYVLDLCCGTGHLAHYFLKKEFQVTGIDLSSGMLNYAKRNNSRYVETGQAAFVQADATNFTLEQKFGLIVSTFDALNHLPDMHALKRCFRSVYNVTDDHGIFIFDLNTNKGLKGWTNIVIEDNEESMIVSRSFYDEMNLRAVTNMTGFSKNQNGDYDRFVHSITNTCFRLDEVKAALLEVGWNQVHFSKMKDLSAPIETPEEEDRIFIVAQKNESSDNMKAHMSRN